MKEVTPACEGYAAFLDGKKPHECRFAIGAAEFAEFRRGYIQAQREHASMPHTVPLSELKLVTLGGEG